MGRSRDTSKRMRMGGVAIGVMLLVASILFYLQLAITILYARSPLHTTLSPHGLPTDELALDVHCPSLLAWRETGHVRATIKNLTPRALNVRVYATGRDFVVSGAAVDTKLTISPGETVGFKWQIRAERPRGGSFTVLVHSPGSGVHLYSPTCVVPVFLAPRGAARQALWFGLPGALLGLILCVPWMYQWFREGRARGASTVIAAIVLLSVAVLVCLILYVVVFRLAL